MTTLLYISSSLFGADGQSSRLAEEYIREARRLDPSLQLRHRDLAAAPIPHLDAERFRAFGTAPEQRSPEQQAAVDESDALIDELRQADRILLGLPMYNFGLPSTLKAYIDHVARAGETFRYTAEGPRGLLEDKAVVIVASRGGLYQNTAKDTQSAYIRDVLGFMGLKSLEFVYAEGLNMGEDTAADARAEAETRLLQLARRHAAARRSHRELEENLS